MNFDLDQELNTRVNSEHRHKADDAMKNFALSGDKLFGVIPIPAQMSKIAAAFVTPLISYATDEAGGFADRIKPGSGKYVKAALPLALYAQPALSDMIAYKKEMSAFNKKLHPLFSANTAGKSGMGKLFDSGERPNAVVAFARNQKHGRHLNKILGNAVQGGVGYAYQLAVNNKTLQGKVNGVTNNEMVREHFTGSGINPQLVMGGLVGSISSWAKDLVHSYLPEEYKGQCGLDLCYAFAEDMEAAAKNLDPLDKKGMERELKEQSRKLITIFKERYRESGWKEMPDRVQEKLEEVAEQIVRPMLMGELDPISVINLAGENRILQNNGRSVARESEVKAALEEQMGKLSVRKMMSIEDFQADTELKVSDVAGAWKTLGPAENAFLSIVVPDAVLLKAGMTQEQIDEHHKTGDKYYDDMAEGILGVMAKQPLDKLREKFSKSEISQMREFDRELTEMNNAPRQREDDLALLDEKAQITHTSTVRKLVAKAYVSGEKPAQWKKLLEERKEKIEEAEEDCSKKPKHKREQEETRDDEDRETTKHREAHAAKKGESHASRGHDGSHER